MNLQNNLTTPAITPSPGVNVNISNPNTQSFPNQTLNSLNNLFSNALLYPKHTVQQINDEKEIYGIQMGIDSSDFILHATKPLIYFVATDSSGNKTSIIPFDIQQHIQDPEPTMQDVKDIEIRLDEKLSSFKNEITDLISKKLEEVLK